MLAGDAFHGADHGGEQALSSLRTLAFGSLAFGAMGLFRYFPRWPSPTIVGMAAVSGIGVLLGSEADLMMPCGRDGIGRISRTRGGQIIELVGWRAASRGAIPLAGANGLDPSQALPGILATMRVTVTPPMPEKEGTRRE